ncbi:4Fe-4S single cluster domain-containing protein, partial [Demequina sp.]|uniref:4Fe-4S single cluster domain-containing protein n=1 Tax=Demequina sp. TaxID=2050685 RepID=UPI0025D86382
LLGGEPFLNTGTCLSLVRRVRAELPGRDVWCWTGYTFEELRDGDADKRELLAHVDVLVDGRYERGLRDLSLTFRGSRNQRVLDVAASLDTGRAVEWAGLATV